MKKPSPPWGRGLGEGVFIHPMLSMSKRASNRLCVRVLDPRLRGERGI